MLLDRISQGGVSAADQAGRAILHHADEFCRRLAGVEWDDDQPLGHDSQIHGHPANAIVSKQSAAVSLVETLVDKKTSRGAHHLQQFAGSDWAAAGILQHGCVRCGPELGEDVAEEAHESACGVPLTSRYLSGSCSIRNVHIGPQIEIINF